MDRRSFLKVTAGALATGSLAAPALAQRAEWKFFAPSLDRISSHARQRATP